MPENKKWTDVKCKEINDKEYKSKDFYDERFGDIKLMTLKNGSSKKIFRKDYITNSQKEAVTKIATLEQRQKLHGNHMSTLLGFSAENKKDFCNNHYEISAYYDFPSSCARTWVDAAGKTGGLKPVTHKDLTHMVYQLLAVEDHLNAHTLCYQDVRPTHVGIRNFDKSEYELVDRLRYPMDAEEVNTNHMLYGQLLYCSPLLFEFVALKSKKKCNDNRAKSDVFSIGMTILALGLDHSVQDCYDMKSKKFDSAKMNSYVNDFDHKFGHENKLLCDIVRYCLEVNEHERFTAHELLSRIECYDNVNPFLRSVTQLIPHHQEVHVESRPVHTEHHHHHEPVRSEVCVETRPTVHHGDRKPVAVYKIVNGERILIEGTPVENHTSHVATSNVVRQSYREPVCTTEVRRSVRKVVEAPTTSAVIRRSYRQTEPTIVRRSHVEGSSRVIVADNTHSGVVRTSGRRVVQAPVTRSSRVVEGDVRRVEGNVGVMRRVEGPTTTGAVRRVEGTTTGAVRRVEGTTTGAVRRVEGGHHHEGVVRRVEGPPAGAVRRVSGDVHVEGNVRRVSGDVHVEGNVRRVSGDAHSEGVVRRVSGDVHVEGEVRRVSGDAHSEGVVRRVSGDAHVEGGVVRKVSGNVVERRLSGEAL
jgi:serine/threonine protein kinase